MTKNIVRASLTIAIDELMSFLRDYWDNCIAIPIKFDNVGHVKIAKESAKKCAEHSEFLFRLLNQLLFSNFFCFLLQNHGYSSSILTITFEKPTI